MTSERSTENQAPLPLAVSGLGCSSDAGNVAASDRSTAHAH